MTSVADALRDAARSLETVSSSPRLDAELLMAHALGVSRSDMLLRYSRDEAPAGFTLLVEQRLSGKPVSQITGEQEFYGLSLKVTPDVLTPRPDTETLIETAIAAFANRAPARILDCGTGTGALLLAALSVWPDATGTGIERSPAALALARQNAERHDMAYRAAMQSGDWTQDGWLDGLGQYDLVLSNPPYVEANDPDLAPDVREHEPAEALFAGMDGLDDYRILVPALPKLLAPNGFAVIEIGSRQADAVLTIGANSGLCGAMYRDLAGNPRALLFHAA